MSIERINTERLNLRRLRESDLEDFNYYSSKASVTKYMSWPAHSSLAASREVLHSLMKQNVWALVHRAEGRMIGTISLDPSIRKSPGCRALGYILDDEYWGEGLMREAATALLDASFKAEDLLLIEAMIRVDNEASKRLIKALGFSLEGCLRAYSSDQNGQLCDFNSYSILREEWLSRSPGWSCS
ncbi:MAG: GNAT family protein [Eubacteriales bacterium]|nr:GNAT family protein [Eubacteriales bacterium]